MDTTPSLLRAISAIVAFITTLTMMFAPPAPPTLPANSANDRVMSCDEAAYPTPTPPPAIPTPSPKSPRGPLHDQFMIDEAMQMPGPPSGFSPDGKLLPTTAAPALPPPPDGQFTLPAGVPTPATPSFAPTAVPTPVPQTPRTVVLQAGHWQNKDLPWQLAQFRSDGTYAAGRAEWQVNLDVATRAATILRGRGYDVRVLPATVPIGCRADVFVALHADGDSSATAHGFKAAYPRYINDPANRRLLADFYIEYPSATALSRSYAITRNMSGYYAFYARRNPYAVDASTPMLILEMGYMTNPTDRALLYNQPDRPALGVANAVDRFLQGK